MKIRTALVAITFMLVLAACESNSGVEFIIHNNGDAKIDSIRIFTIRDVSETRVYAIEPGMVKRGYFHHPEGDTTSGKYTIQVTTKVKGENYLFTGNVGDFKKGVASQSKLEIWFSADSIRTHPTPAEIK